MYPHNYYFCITYYIIQSGNISVILICFDWQVKKAEQKVTNNQINKKLTAEQIAEEKKTQRAQVYTMAPTHLMLTP